MDLATESLRLTVLRYQAGEATALEVVDAQNTVTPARNAYDDGLARYRVALANFADADGEFMIDSEDRRGCVAGDRACWRACGKKGRRASTDEAEAPTPVTVETAVQGAIDHVVTADAVLYPINQANVTPKISAPVKRMLVNRGDHVRAGQVLVELESARPGGGGEREPAASIEQSAGGLSNADRRDRSRG